MARKARIVKANKTPKYSTRKYTICQIETCGRSKSVRKDYLLCRIHFRSYVYSGLLAGWKKGS